jgi:ABC-2 type transport system permease protein
MTFFRNVGALIQKEWRHYFGSPIAYVALFVWTALFGLFFFQRFGEFLMASQQPPSQFGPAPKLLLNEILISWVLYNMSVVALFVTPMITMRLFAEEKRQGTIELLATAPLTDFQIVIGKFLGALALYATMIGFGLLNFVPVWLWSTTKPEWKPFLTAVLGLLLVGACFIAVGLFISTLTKNQIVAGFLTFGVGLIIWLLPAFDRATSHWFVKGLAYVGVLNHIEDLMKGVIDLKDVVYYVSFLTFGLLLAHQSVESQRWRA